MSGLFHDEGNMDAVILAGSRPSGDNFADANNAPVKALISVSGTAMLARVAGTLLGHRRLSKLHILAQDFEAFRKNADTKSLFSEPNVAFKKSGSTIATSIDDLLAAGEICYPVLITTADNVLLSPSIIDEFTAAASGADIAIAVVESKVLLAAYPDSKRTWITLSHGRYSGANLFYFGSPKAKEILRYWAEVEQDRKKGWKILTIFGPWLLFLAVMRLLTIDQLAERVGRKLGLKITIVQLSQAEACIDVDKQSDLELAQKILARQARGEP